MMQMGDINFEHEEDENIFFCKEGAGIQELGPQIIGENPSMLQSGRQDPAFYASMWRSLRESGRWSGLIWNRRRDGECYQEWLTINAMKSAFWPFEQRLRIINEQIKPGYARLRAEDL